MLQPSENSNRWVILSYMSPNVWVSGTELFNQFNAAGYRFFNKQSFNVTVAKLKSEGWFDFRVSPHKPERFQYRLAAGITIRKTPKSEKTVQQHLYTARSDDRLKYGPAP